ncbi:nSTAND1 domain-containing NTPase [Geodermatophilus sp. SYSU D01105]
MTALFLSHSSRDRAAVEQLCERLRADGVSGLFLDFDPADGIPAGRNWEQELYARLRRTDAVVFLASESSVASSWCFAELTLARSLGKPVFPVRLPGGPRLPLLRDVQWVDWDDGGYAALLQGLRRAGLDPSASFAWDPMRRPFPGLEPFSAEDAAVFFGRDREVARLTELLQPTLQHGPGRFIGIVGPSGSGKSSLLRAGLLPRLERLPTRWVVVPPLRPGRQPTRNLARSLEAAFTARGRSRAPDEVEACLRRGPACLRELTVDLAGGSGDDPVAVLVVVDQAEELVTRSGAREQQAFLSLLEGARGEDSPLWVVATVRSEFLSTAPDRAGLADAMDDSLVVEPLSRSRLPEVIERPAERAGIEFSPGLVQRMVEETSGGDALPLLAYTLSELYQGMDASTRRVTIEDYEALGGVVGALRNRADRLADELDRRGRGGLVLPTLLRLANVEGESEPSRRHVRRSAFTRDEQMVVDGFVDARLLTTDEDWVEVAHEALLRQWPPLREAIEDARSWLRLRSELERLTADWEHARRDESFLVHGTRLAAFDRWAAQHPDDVGPAERQFLDASRALASAELAAARRSNRRLRSLSGVLAVLLVVALAAGAVAWVANQQAQAKNRLALSRQVAAQSNRLVDSQPDTAILAGLQSMSLARDQGPEPPEGLVTGLARTTHASRTLTGPGDQVHHVAVSRAGGLVAAAGADGAVHLWDLATGSLSGGPLLGHDGRVLAVDFSPDGRLLASAGEDGTVRLWDVAEERQRGEPLLGHADMVWGVAFSPDGALLGSAGADGTVRLWDVVDGQQRGDPLVGHTDVAYDVAFGPDGRLLVSVGADTTVRFWDVATGRPDGAPLGGHADAVQGVAFSPDGRRVATASWDRTVRLWDPVSREPVGPPLDGYEQPVRDVAFSPDGTVLATADADDALRLRSVDTGRPLGPDLRGHTDEVEGVAFSADGRTVASASWDRTVRLWDVAPTVTVSHPLVGHTEAVHDVAVSPDGRRLATAGADATVRLWDAASGRPLEVPELAHPAAVNGVAFGRHPRFLATAGADGLVRLWDAETGRQTGALEGHAGEVTAVDVSQDGGRLVSAGADTTVRVWDVVSGRQVVELTGHAAEVYGVALDRDGSTVASAGNDGTVRLWDVASGRQDGPALRDHSTTVWGVAFSPDGSELASASADGTVLRWDVASHRRLGEPLLGATGEVYDVAFSPHGDVIAASTGDPSIRVWASADGTPRPPVLTGHTDQVLAVAFSPDGRSLASASLDGTARLWNWQFSSWRSAGCSLLNRNMSIEEWDQVLPGLPYERTCPELPAGPGAPAGAPAARY